MTNIVLNAPSLSRPQADEPRAAGPTRVGGSAEGGDAASTPGATTASGLAGEAPATPGHEALADTVDHLNGLMKVIRRELRFTVDHESGRTVIKVIDAETQEVIRNIPAEEAANVAHNLDSQCAGLIAGIHA